jgi:carbonic anhydrase
LKNINFISYNTPKKYEVINNGHTGITLYKKNFKKHKFYNFYLIVLVKPKDNFNTPSITGSNFGDEFVLHQLHFHWGYNDYQGSEHLIDYEKFPLEVRFLRYLTKINLFYFFSL